MYERNAIILERYFNQMFGYDMKNNIKTNFKEYCELVDCLERYKDISDDEDNIMQEYDLVANKIREIQKRQEMLSKRNLKYQQEREEMFQNIDENAESIRRKFDSITNNIQSIDEQIKDNAREFIEVVTEFNEKSSVRSTCGKTRRSIESEYNKKLNKILDNYKNIDIETEKVAKQFIDMSTEEVEKELVEKIKQNGEKEKIPFNMDVMTKAITLCIDVQKRETEILTNVYEKTNKLFTEIKNNSTKTEKHKKVIKDSKCKLEFVGALKEYLVQFLDNERLTAVNGAEEHDKLMKEACENLDEDLAQINNLYTLLLKEISKKIAKKSYSELYNIEYLETLEEKSRDFERQIKRLNLPVTIINPNYWRIEGMKKIYDVFYQSVTEEYGRDLTEYLPKEQKEEIVENEEDDDSWDFEENIEESVPKKETDKKTKRKIKFIKQEPEDDSKSEIDRKIDMILGFNDENTSNYKDYDDEDDDWEDEENDEYETEEDDDVYYDIWGNDLKDESKKRMTNFEDDDFEDDEDENDEDDWEDEDDYSNDDEIDEEDEYEEDDWEDDDEENPEDTKLKEDNDDWGNEFVKVKQKDKDKKKKGFFDKFKK